MVKNLWSWPCNPCLLTRRLPHCLHYQCVRLCGEWFSLCLRAYAFLRVETIHGFDSPDQLKHTLTLTVCSYMIHLVKTIASYCFFLSATRTKQAEPGWNCAMCLKSAFPMQLLALVSLARAFGSSEKFAYANFTNPLTRGWRGIRVVFCHPTPADMAFANLCRECVWEIQSPTLFCLVVFLSLSHKNQVQ